MREQSLRASPSSPEREYRPGHGGKAKSSGSRSRRATNLGRLGKAIGLDVLGAALGLSSEAVRILVDGRDHAREQQYAAHLAARFKDAGIPASWLDNPDAKVNPEFLSALRKFAAASNNKTPIRRANFHRILAAFSGREEVLADALEMLPSAVMNVADGLLELDDGRFGHLNPRLIRAGFPDGWLEQAEPDLTDAMLLSLEQLATDDYERAFEAEEAAAHAGQVFVSQQLAPEIKTTQPAAAPVEKSKETVMAPPRQPKATESTPPKPEFKAAGMPAATKPMAHPSAGGARLPRSVMAAGRKVTSAPVAKPIATNATKQSAKAGTPPPQLQAMPQMPAQASNAVQATKQATPDARRTLAPRGTVTKEVSLARAVALDKLLENARRGAKVTLWRDLLGSSLPFWGNIRRGSVLFRDDLAEGAVRAMGLPEGWLDNPSFPPATMAAWVTDENAPVPTAAAVQTGAQEPGDAGQEAVTQDAGAATAETAQTTTAPKRNASKPFARSTAPVPPKVTMTTQPPSTMPIFPGAEDSTTPAAAKPAPAKATTARAPAVAPAPQTVTAAPSVGLTSVAVPVAGQPGPLCQALISIITAKSAAGTFTETDALALINKLMA